MRIALVSQEYPPQTGHGGIATQTFLKANGLSKRGHDISVISHSIDGRRSEESRDGVRVVRIPGLDDRLDIRGEAIRWLTYSALVAEELEELHSRVGFDLVDFPDWGSEGYLHLLNRAPSERPRAVVHLHGPLVMFTHAIGWPSEDSDLYLVGRHMESTSLSHADAVLSSSRCSARWCVEHYGIDDDIDVIHLGVDTTIFRPVDVPKESRPTVAFVSKMVANKGVEVLAEAALAAVATIPALQVWLIGPDDQGLATIVEERARAAGHPGLFKPLGFRSPTELPDLLSRAHLFVAPSHYEGGPGFTVLEAMACGLPVIASDGSGLAEVVEHGETGYLVAPRDSDAIAGAMEEMLLDDDLREKMSKRAVDYIEREADTTKRVIELERFYEKVVASANEGERR